MTELQMSATDVIDLRMALQAIGDDEWSQDNEGLVLRGGPATLFHLAAALGDLSAMGLAADLAVRVRPYGAGFRLADVYLD